MALNKDQAASIYSLVLLALVRKTGSALDRPDEPRFRDMQDRWLTASGRGLGEGPARLAEVWATRLLKQFE